MMRRVCVGVILTAASLAASAAAQTPPAGPPPQSDSPAAYMPKSLDGIAVRTCVLTVSGTSTCGPDTLGDAALDSARLGFMMMQIAGLTGSDDKRWDSVVYGVTDRLCSDGGTSVGAMRTQPGISTDVRRELEGLVASQQMPIEKTKIEDLDVYVGYLEDRGCIAAFGYPSDHMILLAFAGKDDRAQAQKAIRSMLGAATGPGKRP